MKKAPFLLLLILFSSCSSLKTISPDSEQMTMSTLWYQHAAEMRAIYYQSFNLAELRVKQAMENYSGPKQPAVVVDIDETMLDNSPSEGKNILEGERYSKERWHDWTSKAAAKPLPGSLPFAQMLEEQGVELFYISNRSVNEMEATIENLKKYDFPNADPEHVLLKSTTSNKTERRNMVASNHEIILLIGDNLGDFSEIFDHRNDQYGKTDVDKLKDKFGRKFIVLPNPMYGTWTSALLGSTSGLTPKEIAKLRKNFLVDY